MSAKKAQKVKKFPMTKIGRSAVAAFKRKTPVIKSESAIITLSLKHELRSSLEANVANLDRQLGFLANTAKYDKKFNESCVERTEERLCVSLARCIEYFVEKR